MTTNTHTTLNAEYVRDELVNAPECYGLTEDQADRLAGLTDNTLIAALNDAMGDDLHDALMNTRAAAINALAAEHLGTAPDALDSITDVVQSIVDHINDGAGHYPASHYNIHHIAGETHTKLHGIGWVRVDADGTAYPDHSDLTPAAEAHYFDTIAENLLDPFTVQIYDGDQDQTVVVYGFQNWEAGQFTVPRGFTAAEFNAAARSHGWHLYRDNNGQGQARAHLIR